MSLTIPETEVPRDKLRAAVQTIVDEVDPEAVYLFGSQARGDAGTRSDVDLLVVIPNGTDRDEATDRLYEALAEAGFAKELVVLTRSQFEQSAEMPGSVVKEIEEEGVLLYEQSR